LVIPSHVDQTTLFSSGEKSMPERARDSVAPRSLLVKRPS
jgi:hypothetical protein